MHVRPVVKQRPMQLMELLTCVKTKQNSRKICSSNAGNEWRWKTHEKLKEESTCKDDKPIDTLPVSYQRHKYSSHRCRTTEQRGGPNSEMSRDSG